jgi:hypothetical protein
MQITLYIILLLCSGLALYIGNVENYVGSTPRLMRNVKEGKKHSWWEEFPHIAPTVVTLYRMKAWRRHAFRILQWINSIGNLVPIERSRF